MKKVFIYSTLSSDMVYASWDKGPDLPKRRQGILIKGGAGIASKHLITPKGVVTEITDEELKELKENQVFNLHCTNGFIKIEYEKIKITNAIKDMEPKDKSTPLVPSDFPSPPKTPTS